MSSLINKDKKRSGRPREVDRAAVVNAAEAHPSMTMWWGRRGPIFWELLEQGKTVNSDVYCEQLEKTRRTLRNRRIPVIFLDDNAKPYRSRQTRQKIADLGWETLDHPPYSPDMAPSDFYLFRSLEHWLKGKKFRTIEEMRQSLTEFFDSKD
uniref:Transposase n=1 Tax=Acrobeloides nanus TaxID=290746 RepID=A0A914DZI5_9BILA